MSEQDEIRYLISAWRKAVDGLLSTLSELPADAWQKPTDLPGWNVHAVVAHVAHLESMNAGRPQEEVEVPHSSHMTAPTSALTESGVVARAKSAPSDLIAEIDECTTFRHKYLMANPPTSLDDTSDGFSAFMGWSWRTALMNRVVDVWMHDRDVRVAAGMPVKYLSLPARHTVHTFLTGLGRAFGKNAKASEGQSVVLTVQFGPDDEQRAAVIVKDGRGVSVDPATVDHPTVAVTLSVDDFVSLAGGRRVAAVPPQISGDTTLGQRLVESLNVSP